MRGVSFAQRFRAMAAKRSSLCIGLDPSEDLLRLWNLPVSADGARQCRVQLMDAAHSHAAVVKPQSAFFEQFGVEGMAALRDVVAYARAQGFLVLLDCKRGDIGSTANAYARAYLEHGGDFEVDAITVQAYLGTGTLSRCAAASRTGKAISWSCSRRMRRRGDSTRGAARFRPHRSAGAERFDCGAES